MFRLRWVSLPTSVLSLYDLLFSDISSLNVIDKLRIQYIIESVVIVQSEKLFQTYLLFFRKQPFPHYITENKRHDYYHCNNQEKIIDKFLYPESPCRPYVRFHLPSVFLVELIELLLCCTVACHLISS